MSVGVSFNIKAQNVGVEFNFARVRPLKSGVVKLINKEVYNCKDIQGDLKNYQSLAMKVEKLNKIEQDWIGGKPYSLGKHKILPIVGVIAAIILVPAILAATLAVSTLIPPSPLVLLVLLVGVSSSMGGIAASTTMANYCSEKYSKVVEEEEKHTIKGIKEQREQILYKDIRDLKVENIKGVVAAMNGSIKTLENRENEVFAKILVARSTGDKDHELELCAEIKRLEDEIKLLKEAIEDVNGLVKSITPDKPLDDFPAPSAPPAYADQAS